MHNQQVTWRAIAICLAMAVPAFGQTADNEPAHRYGEVRADLFSIRPEAGISTYLNHGSGAISGYGTLDLDVAHDVRRFTVNVTPVIKDGRLSAKVEVVPAASDTVTQPFEKEFDLAELQGQTLELARDPDGRVYRVNVAPNVVEIPKPVQFRAADLKLEYLNISSPVILNDQEYIGYFGAGITSLAWFDVLKVGLVEFSLLHLKDAKPWGTLQNGVLNIRHENGTTISMRDVQNGWPHRQTLPGGPYTVWVRWKESTMTEEQYHQGIAQALADVKARIANGDTTVAPDAVERLERLIASDRPTLMTSGMRPVRRDELQPDK
jgi:hypothetical protein